MMMSIAFVSLFCILHLVCCYTSLKPIRVRGDISLPNNLPGVYMVEFSTAMKDHGKETILEHFKKNAFPVDSNHKISFRTKTRTKLFHGHSFRVHGDFDEMHLLNIPGAINVFRVLLILINFIAKNNTIFNGYIRCDLYKHQSRLKPPQSTHPVVFLRLITFILQQVQIGV
jgi:hypothetical protein